MSPEEIIDSIIEGLTQYPDIKMERNKPNELKLYETNVNGLGIELYADFREHTVYIANFHWHFRNDEKENMEMYDLIINVLLGNKRLKIWSYNEVEHKWVLQQLNEDGNWIDEMSTGKLKKTLIESATIYYRQNQKITMSK